jgi:hypothetical protein
MGFWGWFGTVEECDTCEEDTAHIAVDDGASVCVHCGEFEGADAIEDEAFEGDSEFDELGGM